MTKPAFLISVFAVLLFTSLVYYPGLSGGFALDDISNIVNNENIAITHLSFDALRQAALSNNSGPLGRPLSMLSFAFNYYATGLNPFYFKLTNLIIHLCNGVGLFVLGMLLLNAYRDKYRPELSSESICWIALATAAAWLLHPLNLTSVLYVVQRMTSLASLFTILALIFYIWGRIRLRRERAGYWQIVTSLLIFMPLAAFSKENGVLMPLFMLAAEITLFNFETATIATRKGLIALFSILVVLPAGALLAFVISHPEWLLNSYATRDFTLAERLLTESRVLFFYLRLIILPDTMQMGIFHDDIEISRSLLQPAITFFATAGIAGLLAIAWFLRRRLPLLAFGLFFFFAGHVLESTVFPLEIAYEHRNYLPMYGILLPLMYGTLTPLAQISNLRLRQFAAIAFVAALAFGTANRASYWINPYQLGLVDVKHHPASMRANFEMGRIYLQALEAEPGEIDKYLPLAQKHFEKSVVLDKNSTEGLFGLLILDTQLDKPVDSAWLTELARRLEFSPFGVNSAHKLFDLVACQEKGRCKLPHTEVLKLLHAALRNPTNSPSSRNETLTALSYYLVNVMHNYSEGVRYAHQAADVVPTEVQYRINLVSLLVTLGENEQASKELEIARFYDKLHIFTPKITQLQAILDSRNEKR